MARRLLALLIFMSALVWSQENKPVRISLDGPWLFRPDGKNVGIQEGWFDPSTDRGEWVPVQTPNFWEAYPGLAEYDGWGWYARTFTVLSVREPLSVHFAGVDDDAIVWINGIELGSHTGYSDPFVLALQNAVRAGENTIVVLVKDYAGGGGIYRPVTVIETACLDQLLKSPYYGTPARPSADWVTDAVIYSVYLRSFSPEGTFAGLERQVPALKELGVTVLWLLPIHPVGVVNRKGTLGSPYAVRDFYGINPEFGTMDDFRQLLSTVHRHGMKLILDLVANHTSWDSKLIKEHPEWFTKDRRGSIVAPNADWTDVADLDYTQQGLRQQMIAMMRWWVQDVGIDGFRCDVAELVPTDFWNEARATLDSITSVLMLSEGSIPEHHVRAFDLTYSWNVYDALDLLLQGKRPVALIDQILKTEELQFPVGSLRMRFTTNHDKNAWDAPAVRKFGQKGLALATVLVNTLPGVPMIYTGEEIPNDRMLSLFGKVPIDWSKPRTMAPLYHALFRLRKEHPALPRGTMKRLTSSDPAETYAFVRSTQDDHVLVVLNFSRQPRVVTLAVSPAHLGKTGERVTLHDVFSSTTVEIGPGTAGSTVSLPAQGYVVCIP